MATRLVRRYEPITHDMLSLRDMMDRLVESAFVSPTQWMSQGFNMDAPAIDVIENQDGFIIKAALPGWKAENVDVMFENGVVTLRGEVKEETEQQDEAGKYHCREIRRSSFVRRVALPTEIQTDKTKAAFENGLLILNLPKSDVVKPKQIKIDVK